MTWLRLISHGIGALDVLVIGLGVAVGLRTVISYSLTAELKHETRA